MYDLEGINSKFRRLRSLCIVPENISVRFEHSPMKTVGRNRKIHKKSTKNENDLCDLDFDPVTLRLIWDVDLVHTYL